MANFKFVKSATAAVLGASVLTTAVVVPGADASAKTTYKVNKYGYLVNAKTNKKVNGYKTYKGKLYKNGKKFTGKTSSGVYYVKGKKFTGKTKYGYYYVNGKRFTGTTKYGYYYVNGKRFNGKTKYGNLYVNGKRYTGTTKYGYTYYNGKRVEGEYKEKVYTNGKLVTGLYKEKLYNKGVLETGLDLYKDKLYKDGVLNVGYALYNNELYKDGVLNVGYALYNNELYKDTVKNVGFIADPLKDGKAYYDALLANGTYDVEGVEKAFEDGIEVGAKVKSVEAINGNEVKLTFNKSLTKYSAETASNYKVSINGTTEQAATKAELQNDKRSVIIELATSVKNAETYKVSVDGLVAADLKAVEKYTSETKIFNDTTKASLVSVAKDTNKLVLTFDEPVSPNANTKIYLDGTELGASTFTPVSSPVLGKYVYEVALTAGEDTAAAAVATHKVDVYYADDAAGNETLFTTSKYSVGTDTEAPYVTKVEAKGQNSFKIFVNEPFTGFTSASNLKVKKGNYTFASGDVTLGAYDSTDKSYTVTVTSSDTNNPLYATGENSVSLNVDVTGIIDASGLVGAKYNSNVNLSKDTTAPKLENTLANYVDGNDLYIKFDENLGTPTLANVVVRDKDGLKVTPSAVTAVLGKGDAGTTEYVKVALSSTTAAPYTVQFLANSVQDTFGNFNSSALSTTVSTQTVASEQLAVALNGVSPAPSLKVANNVITIDYAKAMDSSAISLSNYKFNDGSFPTGTTIGWGATKNIVEIVLPDNTFAQDTTGIVTITSGVKTDAGKAIYADAAFTKENVIKLGATDIEDNIKPTLTKAAYVVANSTDVQSTKLRLSFSEAVALNAAPGADNKDDFSVVVNGKSIAVSSVALNGKYVELTLAESVNVSQAATVTVLTSSTDNPTGVDVTDASLLANKLASGSATATTKEQ